MTRALSGPAPADTVASMTRATETIIEGWHGAH
jgi:hypothetical protein